MIVSSVIRTVSHKWIFGEYFVKKYSAMKTQKLSGLILAFITTMISLTTPRSTFGQGNSQTDLQVDFYFAVAPLYGTPDSAAFLVNYIKSMQNTNQPLVPLIYSGEIISATNAFSYYPENSTGNGILAGVHVHSTTTFSLNNITWISTFPGSAFTNVFSGTSFGSGNVGANGSVSYTSGNADNVPLTDLWITPGGGIGILLNPGESMDEGLASFANANGPNEQLTETCIINGVTTSGSIVLQVRPNLYMTTDHTGIHLSWEYWSTTWPFILEQNLDLCTTNWTTVTNPQSYVNGIRSVTVPNNGSNMFFRLKYQQ